MILLPARASNGLGQMTFQRAKCGLTFISLVSAHVLGAALLGRRCLPASRDNYISSVRGRLQLAGTKGGAELSLLSEFR